MISLENPRPIRKTKSGLRADHKDRLYYISKLEMVRQIRANLRKESIPSFCFGRVMGMCPYTDGMETWPITKTRGFKIGSDASLCNAVIDYNNADPVHLILVNESALALELRQSKATSISAEASLKSNVSSKSSAPSTVRTSSSRSRSSIANSQNTVEEKDIGLHYLGSEMNVEQPPVLCAKEEKVTSLENSLVALQDSRMMMEIDDLGNLDTQATANANGSQSTVDNLDVMPSSESQSTDSSHKEEQNLAVTRNASLKTEHLENSWYVKVVGRTGVYINNYYHGCVTESSTSESVKSKLVAVKSGDHLRIGEWLGTLYFT